jgi:putative phage-type endonuclease
MSFLSELIQNSPEWYAWRNAGLGASEIAAVKGVCPWKTPYDIFQLKMGRAKNKESFVTRHGHEAEAKARARYELVSMRDMTPACAIHPRYEICRASLDGVSSDGKRILEIKCPKSLKTLEEIKKGKVPEHYMMQVQYQLAVTGADVADFFVYHEDTDQHELKEVKPDLDLQGELIMAALLFWGTYVEGDTPPPLTDRDIKVIDDDPEVAELCDLIFKNKMSASKAQMNEWKQMAVSIAGHPKIRCGQVQIATVKRNGVFSYHKLTLLMESGETVG